MRGWLQPAGDRCTRRQPTRHVTRADKNTHTHTHTHWDVDVDVGTLPCAPPLPARPAHQSQATSRLKTRPVPVAGGLLPMLLPPLLVRCHQAVARLCPLDARAVRQRAPHVLWHARQHLLGLGLASCQVRHRMPRAGRAHTHTQPRAHAWRKPSAGPHARVVFFF